MRSLSPLLLLALAIASSLGIADGLSVPRSSGALGSGGRPAAPAAPAKTFRGGAAKATASASKDASSGKSSLSASAFNLIKACVGSGVLALPAGVAAIGDSRACLGPATAIIVGLGAISAYSFLLLGRVNDAGETESASLGDMWTKEVGASSSWLVTLSCLLTPLGAALAYSIMLGDMLSSLAQAAGVKGVLAGRRAGILAISSLVLYPLCNLKSLAALAPVSMVAVLGVIATALFMYLRMAGGAYAAGGAFFDTVAPHLRASFDVIGNKAYSPSILVLGGMAATAYLVHFSAMDFHNNLEDNNVKRFGTLVGVSFGVTAIINVMFMMFGFLTFGGSSSGLILNNYSPSDVGASLCRLLTVISLVGSYHIFMRGIRSSFLELFRSGQEITDGASKRMTAALLSTITALALVMENAGFVVGLTGATMGSLIIYSIPPLLFLKSSSRRMASGALQRSKRLGFERLLSKFLIGLGAVVGILGGVAVVLEAFFPGTL